MLAEGEKKADLVALAVDGNFLCGEDLSFFYGGAEFIEKLTQLVQFLRDLRVWLREPSTPTSVSGEGMLKNSVRKKLLLAQETHIGFSLLEVVLDKYQEQPHLLDPWLERMVMPVVEHLLNVILDVDFIRQGLPLPPLSSTQPGDKQLASPTQKSLVEVMPVVFRVTRPFFRYIYHVHKVRGPKIVVKLLTHEVANLEPLVAFVELCHEAAEERDQESAETVSWETRYVLLLWLSLLCMIPFDLRKVDSGLTIRGEKVPLVERVLNLGKEYLFTVSKEHEGAAMVVMRLLLRTDTAPTHLLPFVRWAAAELNTTGDVFRLRGVLLALCTIFNHGRREMLLHCVEEVIMGCTLLDSPAVKNNSLLRKLLVKLAQRAGLACLKPKQAKWRYQRGHRSLEMNLGGAQEKSSLAGNTGVNSLATDTTDDEVDDEDIPEHLDTVMDHLFKGLQDKDTIVRWSAAKGIGRITSRLSQEFGDQIISTILSLLEDNVIRDPVTGQVTDVSMVEDHTWHGACLSLAELARRGLLLPDRLGEVVPWIMSALLFDQKRGAHSVGAHVRDAACYVIWSFARAYAPETMTDHVMNMARALVVVAVCDREVNIRRAASAAFQENVGRQGVFPNGIEIVTAADYFTVGNRTNAYLVVAVEIAKFSDYRHHIIDHISNVSLAHWDISMREVAAEALSRLTVVDERHVLDKVVPLLIERATSDEMVVRHGALLGLGEILLAWAKERKRTHVGDGNIWNQGAAFEERVLVPATNLLPTYPRQYLDGIGNTLTRIACCIFIAALTEGGWPHDINAPAIITSWQSCWQDTVLTSLEHREESVQAEAVQSLKQLHQWKPLDWDTVVKYLVERTITQGSESLRKRGAIAALGALSGSLLQQHMEEIFDGLILASTVQAPSGGVAATDGTTSASTSRVNFDTPCNNDAESRRNSIGSITSLCITLGPGLPGMSRDLFARVFDAFMRGMNDYSTDSRGDVGSWIRQASICGLEKILPLVLHASSAERHDFLTADMTLQLVRNLVQQSVEKIDKMREVAGSALIRFVWGWQGDGQASLPDGLVFEGREALRTILPRPQESIPDASSGPETNPGSTGIMWNSASEVYPLLIPLLNVPQVRRATLSGLVVAVGGMSESLVRHSSKSLLDFCENLPLSAPSPTLTLPLFFQDLLDILTSHRHLDRVTKPILEVLELMLTSGLVSKLVETGDEEAVLTEMVKAVRSEVFKSRDFKKVISGIKVFSGILNLPPLSPASATLSPKVQSLSYLVTYLIHPFPKVRRSAAEDLYLVLSGLDPDDQDVVLTEEAREEVEGVLLGTDWDANTKLLKEPKETVARIFGLAAAKS
ncbi:tubulin folding cofactor D C terminal-domain-containing protein [Phlyctochytrium arcticum]|nr:tubulin folding cofactor D C terminal-domain-containing protein [Phlyctochytrium arcticum]